MEIGNNICSKYEAEVTFVMHNGPTGQRFPNTVRAFEQMPPWLLYNSDTKK